ncbi:hypothetical protein L210DRAFT_881927 [Boletus edulis BED1]|uniref:T6SS Phospholipase effector Tle1-like catalytic domain-containing protein n=1 Tax=Boletus edulis BED1 TaxID=1328754 RepID=A0AAD4C164_BOLED|nr:hypothetical protein L210DRAFT_881927 [Boletus edulis BED1]
MSTASTVGYTEPPKDTIVGTSNPPLKTNKRIIVCCDGTWQDGVGVKERWKRTNVLKLSRALKHHDERTKCMTPQVVFYQTGIGSSPNFYSEYIQAATGASLAEKVQEAYAFITQNYCSGDEIFLFGFSRGAYTVRMVAMFIGAIGVLDKTDMDDFGDIFVAYQKLGKSNDPAEIAKLQAKLAPWTSPTSRGKSRATSKDHPFSIKCVGVFDTVGSLGLPEEITHKSPSIKSIFGFPNAELGEHIERAYQTLAINETRLDFNCNKFEQTQGGRRKGQILKQCWFSGEHSDIGGGWHDHDLSDLTLFWMVANIEDMLCVDLEYIRSLPDPVAPWGKQPPHDSRTGIFALTLENTRSLPIKTDSITHQTIHPSVLEQDHRSPQLLQRIQNNPLLMCSLLPLEEEMRRSWPYVPGKNVLTESKDFVVDPATGVQTSDLWSVTRETLSAGRQIGTEIFKEVRTRVTTSKSANGAAGKQLSTTSRLMNHANESRAGAVLKEGAKSHRQ